MVLPLQWVRKVWPAEETLRWPLHPMRQLQVKHQLPLVGLLLQVVVQAWPLARGHWPLAIRHWHWATHLGPRVINRLQQVLVRTARLQRRWPSVNLLLQWALAPLRWVLSQALVQIQPPIIPISALVSKQVKA